MLIGLSLIIGTPFFIFFGWLSDRVGRLKIILAGCLIAAVTYYPLFAGLTHYVNPDLEAFAQKNPITLTAEAATCKVHIFVTAFTKFSTCDRAKDFITKLGLSFTTQDAPSAADKVDLVIGSAKVSGFATPRCRCRTTSTTAGSAACYRSWRRRSWPPTATSISGCGIQSGWR